MKRMVFVVISLVVVIVLGILTINSLPKRYQVHEGLAQATLFWNDQEAFVFIDTMIVGRTQNVVLRKIASSRYGSILRASGMQFSREVRAYHLLASGTLERIEAPQGLNIAGHWELADSTLQFTTYANRYNSQNRIRWDGKKFETLTAESPELAKERTLGPETEDEESTSFLSRDQRAAFKAAGWHWKVLTGREGATGAATLELDLRDSKFYLAVQSMQPRGEPGEESDFFSSGGSRLQLSGDRLPSSTTLWEQSSWQELDGAAYERRFPARRRPESLSNTFWLWLAIFLGLMGWKVWSWIRVIVSFTGMKKRVINNMATILSFPSASTAQFPRLDAAEMERYTRELESLGFTRLIDTSPTSDSPTYPSMFSRLMVHTGNHCYGEITQVFPRGKAPMEMRCAISSHLQNGWSVAFSNRKPLAASSLIRRPKALGVSAPGARPAELLQSLLTLRQQMCMDLGISPLTEDSLESYIAKAQQSLADMRTAVKHKNFATALPQFYYRKVALVRTKPEYVWLGAYPKEAEQRKQQYSVAPVN